MKVTKINKPILSLSQFMLRQQVLKLYRDFLKSLKIIKNSNDRKEMINWVKHDFKNNKNLKSEEAIKMQLTRGKIELKNLETTISNSHLNKR